METLENGKVRVFDKFAYKGKGAWKEVMPVDAREMLKKKTASLTGPDGETGPGAPARKDKKRAPRKKSSPAETDGAGDSDDAEDADVDENADEDMADYGDLKKKKLRKLLRAREIKFEKDASKQQLVELLQADDAGDGDEDEDDDDDDEDDDAGDGDDE